MDYVDFEGEVENANASDEKLIFSENLNDDKFIDDNIQEKSDSPSFCKFVNQTRDPAETLNDNDKSKLDVRDLEPEIFYHIKREFVEFDEFDGYQKCANKLKKKFCSFQGDLKDSFFDAILYGLLFKFSEYNKID